MNMYSLLQTNPHPTEEEIENHFDGNICRCTGYRPILESFKSFAHDDEGRSAPCDGQVEDTPTSYKHFGSEGPADACSWMEPRSTKDLCTALWGAKQAGHKYRIVAGNTGHGVYPDDDVTLLVNVAKIPDMVRSSKSSDGSLVFGGAVPIQVVIDTLKAQPATTSGYHSVLATHMLKIANYQVRNVGSWAGNLAMCHAHPIFQSDMATILSAVDARLTLVNGLGQQDTIGVTEFFAMADISAMALVSLAIPPEQTGSTPALLRTYKAMKRHQNSHAFVNAGINCTFNVTHARSGVTVTVATARLIFGGIQPHPQRAPRTEAFLHGKNICDPTVMQQAMASLSSELVPATEGYAESAGYRTALMTGFLFKYGLDACKAFGGTLEPELDSAAAAWMERPVSSSTQTFDPSSTTCAAVPKLTSHRQAAGEALYADDHPPAVNGLFASYVLSTIAHGRISAIDTSVAMTMPGVVDFIAATDLGDRNTFTASFEPGDVDLQIFAPILTEGGPGDVEFWGQPIGMIIADTREHADRAAKLGVTVQYEGVEAPVVTIDQAIAAGRTGRSNRQTRGDAAAAFSAAGQNVAEGTIDVAGQCEHTTIAPASVNVVADATVAANRPHVHGDADLRRDPHGG